MFQESCCWYEEYNEFFVPWLYTLSSTVSKVAMLIDDICIERLMIPVQYVVNKKSKDTEEFKNKQS